MAAFVRQGLNSAVNRDRRSSVVSPRVYDTSVLRSPVRNWRQIVWRHRDSTVTPFTGFLSSWRLELAPSAGIPRFCAAHRRQLAITASCWPTIAPIKVLREHFHRWIVPWVTLSLRRDTTRRDDVEQRHGGKNIGTPNGNLRSPPASFQL